MIEGQEGVSWAQWLELASAAERHGFEGLFRSDHYMSELPASGREALDAWGTICALAAVTSRIRLGTAVSPASFRHPSVLAKLVVTADLISNGRVELGIGAGWYEDEHRAYGIPFLPAGRRTDVLAEQLEVIAGTWAVEGAFDFAGEHYSVEGLDARPRPVQRPRPPIVLGGSAGPRSAALAARWADEYNTPSPTDGEIAERKAAIREACERAGRPPIRFSILAQVLVAEDSEGLERRAAAAVAAGGEPELDPAELIERLEGTGVVGTPEQAAERLMALGGRGVDRVLLECADHSDLEMIDLIGRRVLPLLEARS